MQCWCSGGGRCLFLCAFCATFLHTLCKSGVGGATCSAGALAAVTPVLDFLRAGRREIMRTNINFRVFICICDARKN